MGHIGGDDFIIFIDDYRYEEYCRTIIAEFDRILQEFYHPGHLMQQHVLTESRSGVVEEIPLVSISIAVVTNRYRHFDSIEDLSGEAARLKKKSKMIRGSSFVDDRDLSASKSG
ncbi:hypothetical protein D3C87_1709050 [compost metagenome]